MRCISWDCIVLYLIVLCCTWLCCIVVDFVVLCCALFVVYCVVLYHTELCRVLYLIVLCYFSLNCVVSCVHYLRLVVASKKGWREGPPLHALLLGGPRQFGSPVAPQRPHGALKHKFFTSTNTKSWVTHFWLFMKIECFTSTNTRSWVHTFLPIHTSERFRTANP